MMMNACAKEVDFMQMQGECAWLKMHVKACELNGCGWKCGCNDEVMHVEWMQRELGSAMMVFFCGEW